MIPFPFQVVKDSQLVIMIFALLILDLTVLVVWEIIDPPKLIMTEVSQQVGCWQKSIHRRCLNSHEAYLPLSLFSSALMETPWQFTTKTSASLKTPNTLCTRCMLFKACFWYLGLSWPGKPRRYAAPEPRFLWPSWLRNLPCCRWKSQLWTTLSWSASASTMSLCWASWESCCLLFLVLRSL